jgi:aspartate 1-decarboxylase
MLIPFLISKIHRATVTSTDVDYAGSISIDVDIMKQARLREFQKVEIYNIANGNRFATYTIAATPGSKDIVINGAAAHLVSKGDKIIIAAYGLLDERELNSLDSVVLLMKNINEIEKVITQSI